MTCMEMQTLGTLCSVIAGQSPEGEHYNDLGEGLPFYQGKRDFGDVFVQPPRVWTRVATKLAQDGDILMSVRAPVGPVNFAVEHCCIGRGLAAIRSGPLLDARYLYYFLLSIQGRLEGNAGAVFPSINKSQIEAIKVPWCSIPEQQRIAAILDEAFAGIAKATANAERNLANARELFESFVNLLLDRDSLHWPSGPVQDMVGEVRTGPFGSLLHKSDYVVGGIPIVNPSHLVDGSIGADQSKTVSAKAAQNLSNYKIKTGDIVIGRRGEMGRCAVVSDDENGWICGTGSFFISPHANVSSHFVAALLRSVKYRRQLEALAGGATMPNLSNSALGQMAIAMPDYQTQKMILSDWRELKDQCWTAADAYRRKRSFLSELKSSLLEKAFSGQLTSKEAVAA